MKQASIGYIIDTVARTNVLPIISECNTACIFCSHRYNPSNIEVFRLPKLSYEDFREIIPYLEGDKKIVVGESATRIIEGEPLLHPEFLLILDEVRRRFPSAPIQVTTNGTLLNEAMVERLSALGNIELNISVNCIRPESRNRILGRPAGEDYIFRLEPLKDKIRFSASIVALPGILSREEVSETIRLLELYGADMVRIFVPGYTRMADNNRDFMSFHAETAALAADILNKYSLPVIVEPSPVKDLSARVEGVIHNTAAAQTDLTKGDIIVAVNGEKPATRVEAYNKLYRSANPVISVNREGKSFNVNLPKSKNTGPGFIMLYDADPLIRDDVYRAANRHKAASVMLVTSELAFEVLGQLFCNTYSGPEVEIVPALNRFFGGTIKCAGLLTADDIATAVRNELTAGKRPDLVLIPPIMFDYKGRDITGTHFSEIEKQLGVAVDIP